MQLSRCILKKNRKKVVMQGIIHGIPKPLLVWLKKDISRHNKNGYRIFYEGIRKYEADDNLENFSAKELEILKCVKLIEDLKEYSIKRLGLNAQYDDRGIKYPKNAINIDISWVEYIKLLAEKEIDYKGFLSIFESIPKEKMLDELVKITEKLLNGEKTLQELEIQARPIDFFNVSNSIEMDYRDSFSSKKIEEFSKRRRFNKIYVQYGESHIVNIMKILIDKYDWELIKIIKLDSQKPNLYKRCVKRGDYDSNMKDKE